MANKERRSPDSSPSTRQDRIPPALQQVFLQSNRGRDVDKPPPNHAASKTFEQNWVHQRASAATVESSKSSRRSHPSPPRNGCKSSRSKTSSLKQTSARTGRERTRRAPPKRQRSLTGSSPQEHLDNLLKDRGYKLKTFRTLNTAYYNSPNQWQMASYGPRMVELVRGYDVDTVDAYLEAGLSPNPCNLFGESLLHMICRRGDTELLEVLLGHGASIQVSDDFGRTPMHDACWAALPSFELAELLLERDTRLFYMKDKRGALPLSYVTRDYWYLWRQFLSKVVDTYFPEENAKHWNKHPPELLSMEPNTRPLPASPNKMPLELVSMVASGRMSLAEAKYMAESGALDRMKKNSMLSFALDEDDDDDDESDYSLDSDLDSDEEDDQFEIHDQVSSMMSLVRAWDKKC